MKLTAVAVDFPSPRKLEAIKFKKGAFDFLSKNQPKKQDLPKKSPSQQ